MNEELEIKEMELKLKELKKQLKEKNKSKTITISGKDHLKIKNYCQMFNVNIGEWAAKILLKEIELNNCIINDKTKEEIKEEEIDRIINKYINKKFNCVFKTNYLIIGPLFKFIGISLVDSKNIYEFNGGEEMKLLFQAKMEENQIEINNVSKNEILNKSSTSGKLLLIDKYMNLDLFDKN